MTTRSRFFIALALVASFALGAVMPALGKTELAPTVVRSALAQTDKVQGAPGRTLVLSRVTVDPGATLALHRHRGTQIARVEAGTLTYSVRSGSVPVRSGEADQKPRLVRTIAAGQTGQIRAGQWIVEQPWVIHHARNAGKVPVEIVLATLLEKGAPPSTSVPETDR